MTIRLDTLTSTDSSWQLHLRSAGWRVTRRYRDSNGKIVREEPIVRSSAVDDRGDLDLGPAPAGT